MAGKLIASIIVLTLLIANQISQVVLKTKLRYQTVGDNDVHLLSNVAQDYLNRDSHSRSKHRIAGGYDAKLAEFPSFVQVRFLRRDSYVLCGGTLLDSRHVLTAAHCSEGISRARVHTNPFDEDGRWQRSYYESRTVCSSPKFARDPRYFGGYDIAIVKLDRPVMFNKFVQPAALPRMDLSFRMKAFAVGMGWLRGDEHRPYEIVKALIPQVLPVERQYCYSHPKDICLKYSNEKYVGVICKGDSGGPIYGLENGNQTVYGVASYTKSGSCFKGYRREAGVFASVFNYRDEINQLLRYCS